MKEFKKAVEKVGNSWEQFKEIDKQRDAEIKKLGQASSTTEEKLAKIQKDIDAGLEAKKRVEDLEIAFKRGGGSSDEREAKALELELEVKSAEMLYLRRGDDTLMKQVIEKKAMSVNSDPDGGYLVTPDTSGRVQKRIYETSPLRSVATVITISTDAIEGLIDIDEAGAQWTAETSTGSDSKTPQLGKYRIPVHEQATRPKVTQKLLEDASFDPQAWIAAKAADKFARAENNAFVLGDGVTKPRGFLSYGNGVAKNTKWGTIEQVNLGTAAALNADGLISLQFALKDQYRANGRWAMTRFTQALARQLKDSQGRYYWQPNYEMGMPATLLGSPIVEMNDMPEVAANALAVVFADWSQFYTIVDRVGVSVLVDPYTAKPYTEFYTRKRVGGDVTNFEAGKIGKIST